MIIVFDIIYFLALCLVCIRQISADFASVKPSGSALQINYVAVSWLSDYVALACGFTGSGGGGVIRSYDKGKSWTQVASFNNSIWGMSSNYISNTWYTVVVEESTGLIYRSTDYGTTWTTLDTGYSGVVFHGASISATGNVFVAGSGTVIYSPSISANVPTWVDISPNSSWVYFDVR